jgi:hypothetical protein
MTVPFDILEPEGWRTVQQKITEERARRIESLLHCAPDDLVGEQQFIAALDWVVEQAALKKDDEEESIYDD